MMLTVTRGVIARLRAEAAAAAPDECCGLLLGQGTAIQEALPAGNLAADPARHFEIDPAALIAAHRAARSGGPQVIGYYHSHPTGDPRPSATDSAQANRDGAVWAIIGEHEILFWRDGPDGFAALSYSLEDG